MDVRLTQQLISKVVETVVGTHATKTAQYLNRHPNSSEFTIAQQLHQTVHETRKTLYELQEHNLTTYYKKKDHKRGWSISYWKLNTTQIRSIAQQKPEPQPQPIKTQYTCPNKCINATNKNAMELGYICPHCGQTLQHKTEE